MQTAKKLEKTELDIGFMPLTDCAPFVVALERGFFQRYGLTVRLHKQNSWSALRDKLYEGLLDAAHMLAPMPLAASLGLDGYGQQMISPMVISRNGNAITLAEDLRQQLGQDWSEPNGLRSLLQDLRDSGKRLRFATVHPYSCHYYQLRSWLRRCGLDTGQVDIAILPPADMVTALAEGDIDGFCVSGPWTARAVREQVGVTVLSSVDIWPNFPDKVLGLLQSWYQLYPNSCYALIAALCDSSQWLANSANRLETARVLCRPEYLDARLEVVAPSLLWSCLRSADSDPLYIPELNQFYQHDLAEHYSPRPGYGEFLLAQMAEAGQIPRAENGAMDFTEETNLKKIFREDIYWCAREIYAPC
ncbi:MAG: ABC transporter substrate-binding protein [Cellvibrionaceae bacterium]|nr:ABC transporter substrate-binding protein [Cellvibrionaceae bacterium]